jgi:hypothetical protein
MSQLASKLVTIVVLATVGSACGVESRPGSPPPSYASGADALLPGPCPPTAAPTPFGPSGPVATLRPTFAWSDTPGATSYTLYVLDAVDTIVVRQTGLTVAEFERLSG